MTARATSAGVKSGRVQKYAPRKGANPDFVVGKPWPGVWLEGSS